MLREHRRGYTESERELVSPNKGSINTHLSPNSKHEIRQIEQREYREHTEHREISSQSDVEGYGANFGEYVAGDGQGMGMIESRREYLPAYGSSVEMPQGHLANSTASYRTNQQQYVNSSQHIRVNNRNIAESKYSIESVSQSGERIGA
jgi:hypothetical protein